METNWDTLTVLVYENLVIEKRRGFMEVSLQIWRSVKLSWILQTFSYLNDFSRKLIINPIVFSLTLHSSQEFQFLLFSFNICCW